MTEGEARTIIDHRFGGIAVDRLTRLANLVFEESERQNLIAPSTLSSMWVRHLLDSAQLIDHAPPEKTGVWLDVGSGAGFPGLVVATLCQDQSVRLVEPRRKRVDFLRAAANALSLGNVTVAACRVEQDEARSEASVISARAVASLDRLFELTRFHNGMSTTYVLPRGQSGVAEVAAAGRDWQGLFHVKHSVTDPASTIVIARGVRQCTGSR